MRGASIVIPVYNAFELLARCLESIYRARTEISFEVIVVDNGSSTLLSDFLAPARIAYTSLRIVGFPGPLGFARAVNEGARRARYDYLVVLNSDTRVSDLWLDDLLQALSDHPELAVVSPLTNRCGHTPQIAPEAVPLDVSDRLIPEPQRLEFFCVMIPRTVWERLGGLDEIYQIGTYEDDDFCLRARLVGYRLAIVPRVFVFHEANQTFQANHLNHSETLAKNQSIFYARASRWSRSLGPVASNRMDAGSLTVIVPVLPSTLAGLPDSLVSLRNQTVSGFETVLAHSPDLDVASAIDGLELRSVHERGGFPALLNAGLRAARGQRIAYLTSGDIFYPFHLEVLCRALDHGTLEAAYCAWSICSGLGGKERRGAVSFDQCEPERLTLGDWAPLLCWMHERSATPSSGFDESLENFTGWQFILDLTRQAPFQYLRQVTCERRLLGEGAPSRSGALLEAERILEMSGTAWQRQQRSDFLAALRKGPWEHDLILTRNEVQRRARRMLGPGGLVRFGAAQIESANARLAAPNHKIHSAGASILPDIFIFGSIEWTALTQRHHHFARGLISRGYRVFWIDVQLKRPWVINANQLTSEVENRLHYIELPGEAEDIYRLQWTPETLDLMSLAIQRIRQSHAIQAAIQLVTYPKWTPLVTRLHDRYEWPIAYDCLDDQQALAELYKLDSGAFEPALIDASSLLITVATCLYELYRPRHSNTILIPNAADWEIFRKARPGGLLSHLPRPIVGFFGAFADWLDLDWIAASALRFPGWTFVYIGREVFATASGNERWRQATAAANITVIPQVDLPNLAKYLAEFDVCIMPFQDLAVTRAMNPVKIYEYLAAGKAVVVPDLPETRPLAQQGLISVYTSRDESFRLLQRAISEVSESQVASRIAFAAANTWSQRLDLLIAAFTALDVNSPTELESQSVAPGCFTKSS